MEVRVPEPILLLICHPQFVSLAGHEALKKTSAVVLEGTSVSRNCSDGHVSLSNVSLPTSNGAFRRSQPDEVFNVISVALSQAILPLTPSGNRIAPASAASPAIIKASAVKVAVPPENMIGPGQVGPEQSPTSVTPPPVPPSPIGFQAGVPLPSQRQRVLKVLAAAPVTAQ